MRTADFISDAATLGSDDARQTPELTRYALEGFAIEVDAKIQSELLTKLILSHSEIARRLETAVETLRRSEAALKEAQQIALLGRWDIDLATGRRVWSESLYSILELDPSTEPTAELFLSRLHPDQREEALRIYAALSERKEPWTIHYRLLMPDGREKVIQLLVHTEYAEGKAVRSYGTLQDVTAVAKAEEELENYNKHLQQMVADKVQELTQAQMATIYALVKLSESRDDDTGAHIERTASFCRLLAEKARSHPAYAGQIDDEFLDSIFKASPLHDIGKVGISDTIL
ncbi:MAG TPA: PAS domain-containing protein, partial [Clostridia bacterium]|nr:PAS domain-containing protein [Clostridia bacterium]